MMKRKKNAVSKELSILKKVQDAEKLKNEIEDKLLSIIKETEDLYAIDIIDFKLNSGLSTVEVEYKFRFRNIYGTNYTSVPVKWLEAGFDYKRAAMQSSDVDPAAVEAKIVIEKELEELKRLKAKYE
jgi:vacuolar-type H+-ATPase subunit D/Vma8